MGNITVNLEFENGCDSIRDTERMSLDSHSMKHSHVLKMEKPEFCNCSTTHMHIASQENFSMTILVLCPLHPLSLRHLLTIEGFVFVLVESHYVALSGLELTV